MILVHDSIDFLVMRFNDISNGFFEVPCLFFLLGLELLELGSILKHLLGVGVSVLFELDLLVFEKTLDSFFEDLFKVTLVFGKGVVSVSVLELGAG